jgi:hypothetical protein
MMKHMFFSHIPTGIHAEYPAVSVLAKLSRYRRGDESNPYASHCFDWRQ